MGQIIGGAAKPKRCNANQLSQVPTPAAGEYILVSSDNSMNAAGQGNFDCYIEGDGQKAATALKLKRIISVDDAVIGIKTDKIARTLDEVCTKKTGLKFTGNGVITSQGALAGSDNIYFSKTLMQKGTVVSFVGEITANSNYYVVSFGFSTTNPNELETIEGLTLTNVLSDTIHKEERSLYYVMPNDGYVFLYYYHYSGDYWKTRDYKIYLTDDYITEIDVTKLNGGASYNDLTAALSAVPISCRKGGITVRFINSNTSKYTQYNLKTSTWSTDIADWQDIFTEEKFKSNFDAYSDKVAFEREDVGSVVSEWQTNDSTIWLITNVDGHNVTLTNVTKTGAKYVGLNISRIPANSHVHLRLNNEGKFYSGDMSLFANLSYQSWMGLRDIHGNFVYPTSDGYLDFVFLKPENANWLVLPSNSFQSGTVINITDFLIERQIDINGIIEKVSQNNADIEVLKSESAETKEDLEEIKGSIPKDESVRVNKIYGVIVDGEFSINEQVIDNTMVSYKDILVIENLGSTTVSLKIYHTDGTTENKDVGISSQPYVVSEDFEKMVVVYRDNNKIRITNTDYPLSQLNDVNQNTQIYKSSKIEKCYPKQYAEPILKALAMNNSLVMLQITDVHHAAQLLRVGDFVELYGELINDYICTGDMGNSFPDTYGFWTAWGVSKFMVALGNHDVSTAETGSSLDKTAKECYDKYLAPFVDSWNVTQPENASTNGYCYYYKDYTTKNVRLIVLDTTHWTNEQNTWLASILADAKSEGYSVIIAQHYPIDMLKVDKTTSWSYYLVNDVYHNDVYNTPEQMLNTIDDFIDGGGDFICHITGHHHSGFVGFSQTHPKQFCIVEPSTTGTTTALREQETRSIDCMYVYGIDATTKMLSIAKFGFTRDRFGRETKSFVYDWNNRKIVYSN